MARKSALVVDDSKSARVILSRMLEKYDIEVDMAESAEQAIEYLKSNRPDAIFMDHLMPGMDGLQAVKAIKGNPQTAMIPIMMYTSQEGELYVGQARALGAMGVLPKQVRPVDVSKVLYELHLLPDRRDAAEAALQPVEVESGIPRRTPNAAAGGGRSDRLGAAPRNRGERPSGGHSPLHRCQSRQFFHAHRQRCAQRHAHSGHRPHCTAAGAAKVALALGGGDIGGEPGRRGVCRARG